MLLYLIQKLFFRIAASFADAAVVYPNGIKTLLANGRGTFFTKGKSSLSNGPESIKRILLIVLFDTIQRLIIIYLQMSFMQKLYEALQKLLY